MKYFFATIIPVLFISIVAHGQDIKFLNKYNSITTTSQLFTQLKGKTIFLDLWAPWCEPCKDEFKYSDTLYQELKKRNVVMLYVSLNSRVVPSEWKADIDHYKLKGWHVLANKELENSLTTLIWGHPGGFSIPRYLLIDREGKILLNDALPPDHGQQLYEQIDKVLQQ